MTSTNDWRDSAEQELMDLRARGGGWPYRAGSPLAVEASALGALAILSKGDSAPEAHRLAAGDAAERIALAQRADGSIGISLTQGEPGWATPFALLLWQALRVFEDRSRSALQWLRTIKGETLQPSDDPEKVVGHDTTLVGWPWVNQTHSWLEPTAMAVLALERWGLEKDGRVQDGRALIRNRAIRSGGWNYGNKAVFGRPLRPQPGPTGLALLALAGSGERPSSEVVLGCSYLQETLPTLRASVSLGWALLGLRAWGNCPSEADDWLAGSYEAARGRADAPVKLAMLLLAAGPASLELFGREPEESGT